MTMWFIASQPHETNWWGIAFIGIVFSVFAFAYVMDFFERKSRQETGDDDRNSIW
jgi:hypothetical protein